jgi:redox-sensitive bicupin YhaK (pirin superfamily)
MKFDPPAQTIESFVSRDISIGALQVARALPVKARRLVGPWCLLDRFGPLTFTGDKPMDVAPHPHTGMQTVTWLLDGEVLHDDSLGCEAVVRPGGVNVMTAGSGIAHAEQTPIRNTGRLNGVQLWVALPDAHPRYEHAALLLGGDCSVEGQPLEDRHLYYLGTSRSSVSFNSRTGSRVLLIGGPPFPETVLMWWNFVARTPEEIAQARTDWEEHRRFGNVTAYVGPRLDAPPLVRVARPNPMS